MISKAPINGAKRFVLLGALLFGLGELAGCSSQSSGALEHKACVEVGHSLSVFQQAQSDADPASASALKQKAMSALRSALHPAALAAAQSSDYQALAATLSESSRVPESELVQALGAQCAVSLSSK